MLLSEVGIGDIFFVYDRCWKGQIINKDGKKVIKVLDRNELIPYTKKMANRLTVMILDTKSSLIAEINKELESLDKQRTYLLNSLKEMEEI